MIRIRKNRLPAGNRLLMSLPVRERERLFENIRPVSLKSGQVLLETGARPEHAYFPTRAALSSLIVMENGDTIEVATIGFEGMVGLNGFLGAEQSPHRVICQIPGNALRIPMAALRKEASADGPLRKLLHVYQAAFLIQVSQAVACNGLHNIQQRCCRWLLMTHDRVQSDELGLTHEFLAIMLGVRRASITEVLHPLQDQGLLKSHRGKISILNRKGLLAQSCECYRIVADEFARLFP
jgi:CRP-like cAMP-binding protein